MDLRLFKNIVILTGAGISAESGIRTFRDQNGLWEDHRIEDEHFEWLSDLAVEEPCPHCGRRGGVRPDIVWFGEMPHHMEEIYEALDKADYFVSIGTSGNVYPAAGFVRLAWKAKKIEINLKDTEISPAFDKHFIGPASTEVPRFITEFLE
ncbi:hypothetical protein EZJ49_07635 [Bdellovibrio bacteriovorus]|uniref:Sir2 family NAD-dependent protein deacetylase n=1 Tax=Bdellovibrio bacteriovorus TaxID=959 RepID=UPI0021CF3492|nr:Sir2 family NAD-dependent protein deacetylase [Bdellovibrio bacteriovorus]UXR66119.1 hypothetical protein EZJ49_07635 [Bdellovibrio bacteriovorus]